MNRWISKLQICVKTLKISLFEMVQFFFSHEKLMKILRVKPSIWNKWNINLYQWLWRKPRKKGFRTKSLRGASSMLSFRRLRHLLTSTDDNIDEAPLGLVCPKFPLAKWIIRRKLTVLHSGRTRKIRNKPYSFFLWKIEKSFFFITLILIAYFLFFYSFYHHVKLFTFV